jgi:hypothetical protein
MGVSEPIRLSPITYTFADLVFRIFHQGLRCHTCMEHTIVCQFWFMPMFQSIKPRRPVIDDKSDDFTTYLIGQLQALNVGKSTSSRCLSGWCKASDCNKMNDSHQSRQDRLIVSSLWFLSSISSFTLELTKWWKFDRFLSCFMTNDSHNERKSYYRLQMSSWIEIIGVGKLINNNIESIITLSSARPERYSEKPGETRRSFVMAERK